MELIILLLLTAFILGSTDKSEYQIKKEADKLPPFTKKEANSMKLSHMNRVRTMQHKSS